MSQEGFPSSGVRRVRDVEVNASQWRIGGAPELGSLNHTRIIDVAYSEAGVQEQSLSQFTVVTEENIDDLLAHEDLLIDEVGTIPINLP